MKTFISGILATVIAGLLLFHFTRERADLVFFLSDALPLPTKDVGKSVQQLEIRNVGNKAAENIVVRVSPHLETLRVIPFSASDKYATTQTAGDSELTYPTLPPDGTIKLILQIAGAPVAPSAVLIAHSGGRARGALSDEDWSLSFWVFQGLTVFYLGLCLRSVYGWRVESLERDARLKPRDVLLKQKPLLLSASAWNEVQKEAARCFFDSTPSYRARVEDTPSYWVLDRETPSRVPAEIWEQLVREAKGKLVDEALAVARRTELPERVAPTLETPMPHYCPPDIWNGVQEAINGYYFSLLLSRPWELDSLAKDGLARATERLLPQFAAKLKELVSNLCAYALVGELLNHYPSNRNSRVESIDAHNSGNLSERAFKTLRAFAYALDLRDFSTGLFDPSRTSVVHEPKPGWIKQEDFNRLRELRVQVEGLHTALELNSSIAAVLSSVVQGQPLPKKKPQSISEEEWNSLLERSREIESVRRRTKKEADRLLRQQTDLAHRREKINMQLQIIHDVLSDPSAIERVEEHSNPFAAGNFENLKRVAAYLQRCGCS